MSRQDIGNYLGLTAETVSRVFSRLQHDKVINTNRKLIHIENPAKLKQIAE
jgi:CRP/FNR family transcriptional regulator